MTRKEELERIARDYENKIIENNPSAESYDYMNAVIYGAEWADKTIIDKACNWLKEHIGTYNDTIDSIHGTIKIFNKEKFIKDLRKAMEE